MFSFFRNGLGEIAKLAMVCTSLLVASCASYFPPGSFRELDSAFEAVPERFSRTLAQMGEPVVSSYKSTSFVVRLTITCAFAGDYVVRLVRSNDGSAIAEWKIFARRPRPTVLGPLEDTARSNITKDQIATLQEVIAANDFWNLSSTQDYLGNDGNEWLLEVKSNERYGALYRWSPYPEDPIFKIGGSVMTVAGKVFDRCP